MPLKKHLSLFTIAVISLIMSASTVSGAVGTPVPEMHVVDRAKIIDDQTENRLNAFLSELESKTGAQMIVLTVKTTGGIPVDKFSLDLANEWKLGQFEKDNGVLMVIAENDRKYSIEVGSGLEGILPDNFCAEIGKVLFVPNFRNNNYNEGIYQGTVAIINKIAGDSGVTVSGTPKVINLPRRRSSGLSFLPILLIFILPMLLGGRRRRAYGRSHWGGMPFFMMMPFMFGGFGGHRGGDSYTGGGFGGFGGGLGGGFGGGGASGGW